jgi:hypothetical protein
LPWHALRWLLLDCWTTSATLTASTLAGIIREALAELDTLEAFKTHRVDLRYLSPCPTGHDTVLGYLAKHNPGVLELLDQEPDATRVDGVKLREVAKRRGIELLKVEACPWLRGFGIQTVNAYPIRLLADHFGV